MNYSKPKIFAHHLHMAALTLISDKARGGGGGGGATYLFLGGYVCRMTQNCDPKPGQNFTRETYKQGKVFPKKTNNH